jgi:hypothetical protein
MDHAPQDLPDDLLDVVMALEHHRPQLTDAELARVKRRATGRGAGTAAARNPRPTGGFMRSRLALIAVLALGAIFSGGGAALGVSAISNGTSGEAQYGPPPCQKNCGTVLGERDQGGGQPADTGAVAGVRDTSAPAQAPRQVQQSSDDELPFTGYAAIPLLLMGIALLGGGVALRRSTRGAPDA